MSYGAVEVPGTQEQSKSKLWFQARKYRITASKCKTVCLLGDNLPSSHAKQFKWRFFNWIQKNGWYPNFVQTNDMQYGINEEPKARLAYTQATGNQVQETGFWVNKKFPYLGASPDGLIMGNDGKVIGLIEIKCLKILKEKSVEDLVKEKNGGEIPSYVLNNQCFTFDGNNLKLRESHIYYYQVQLQMLVTDLNFCDFVLHSPKGSPSIQRITRDEKLMNRLCHSLSGFWHKVLAPEYFEMRVPRNLSPFIL